MATVKDKVFSIRLSQDEYRYLVKEAEKKDMSIGAFIRMMTIGDGLKNG